MSSGPSDVKKGAHYSAAHLGALAGLDGYRFRHPALPGEVGGKVFLQSVLGLTGAEISVNKFPPGVSMPFHHKHRANEEIYIFLNGPGEFQVDGEIFPVGEGTVVRVAPEGVRCWRNLSQEPLYFIVVQAPADRYGKNATIDDGELVDRPVKWGED